jgi:phospholipase C
MARKWTRSTATTEPPISTAPTAIPRRTVLRGAGLLGLGLAFGRFAAPADARVIRPPGTLPFRHLPEGTDTLPQIQNIIILMMENHSFDDHLGTLGPHVGFPVRHGVLRAANPDGNGNLVHAFHMPTTCQPANAGPTQSWNASHIAFSNGNHGFVLASGPIAMGYWTAADIPFYYGLAQTFPLASRWFCSTLCQTYPNRRFLMAGTAAGIIDTSGASLTAPPPPNGNIFERLSAHGISWRNYYSDVPSLGVLLAFAEQNADKVSHMSQFFSDAAAGTLPAVSLVDPVYLGQGSEENGDIRIGELFASRVINAVMESPQWPTTLLVWLYDEHGGYYDHVRPPRAIPPDDIAPNLQPGDEPGGYDRYGFRVPAAVVSPYARPNHVSHVVRDHTAILRFIERKWNLGALTYRDANADDLFDCLDFHHPPAFLNPPTLPAAALAAANPPACMTGPIPPPDAVTPAHGVHGRVSAAARPREADIAMGVPLAEAWAPLGIGPLAAPADRQRVIGR